MSVLVLLLPPDRLGLDPRTPFAQIVAFRPSLAAATMVLSVLSGTCWPCRKQGTASACESTTNSLDRDIARGVG